MVSPESFELFGDYYTHALLKGQLKDILLAKL